jgi:hypothetical protein
LKAVQGRWNASKKSVAWYWFTLNLGNFEVGTVESGHIDAAPKPGGSRAMAVTLIFAFTTTIAACWAWDSRSLHKRLAALEAQVKGQ